MTWVPFIAIAAAGLASMRAAIDRGDLDDAARQGMLAGPAVVEAALAAPDRSAQLAAIAAVPSTAGRIDLLEPLARAAGGPDRRIAIPAAHAARTIARELATITYDNGGELPDELAPDDLVAARASWAVLAARTDRWIQLRILALDTAAALDPGGAGIDLAAALGDRDPDFRRAAIGVVPSPVPQTMRGVLANAVSTDTDGGAALLAAQALCADLAGDPAAPVLKVLGPAGLQRIRTLVGTSDPREASAVRDAARCLAADRSPASAAALRTIKVRVRR